MPRHEVGGDGVDVLAHLVEHLAEVLEPGTVRELLDDDYIQQPICPVCPWCYLGKANLDRALEQNPNHPFAIEWHPFQLNPDMPKEVFKQMWQTIGRGDIFRGMVKNRAKDGTPYYVDAVIAPILGENGKPMKYLGVRYDITDVELERQNARGVLTAIDTNYAYIEFDLGGNILGAVNEGPLLDYIEAKFAAIYRL